LCVEVGRRTDSTTTDDRDDPPSHLTFMIDDDDQDYDRDDRCIDVGCQP
jgi:hypothetical protein